MQTNGCHTSPASGRRDAGRLAKTAGCPGGRGREAVSRVRPPRSDVRHTNPGAAFSQFPCRLHVR